MKQENEERIAEIAYSFLKGLLASKLTYPTDKELRLAFELMIKSLHETDTRFN